MDSRDLFVSPKFARATISVVVSRNSHMEDVLSRIFSDCIDQAAKTWQYSLVIFKRGFLIMSPSLPFNFDESLN